MLDALAALDLLQLLYVATLTLAGSIVSGLSGLGGGVLIAIAVTPFVGLKPLVPTLAVAMLINHIARVWVFRRFIVVRPALVVLASAAPAAALGALLYVRLPVDLVAIVLGAFLVIITPARHWLQRESWVLSERGLALVGGIFGFVTGTTIGAGAIIVPALLGTGLSGQFVVGTDALIGLVVLIVKALTFSSLDVFTPQLVAFGLVVGACSVPGVYLARLIVERTSVRIHTLFIEAVVVLAGLSFIYRGLESMNG